MSRRMPSADNGQGYDCGSVPDWFAHKFDSRRACVCVLEVVAQILANVTLAGRLGEAWAAFIDNSAGHWALNKGKGPDPAVNGILSAFWSLAKRGWQEDWK